MTLSSSGGTITTPGDGWLFSSTYGSSSPHSFVALRNSNFELSDVMVQGNAYGPNTVGVLFPVSTGDNIRFDYKGSNVRLAFYPAVGSN